MKKISIKEIITLAALITAASGCGAQTAAPESAGAITEAVLVDIEDTAEELLDASETITASYPDIFSADDETVKEKVNYFYSEEHKNDRRSGSIDLYIKEAAYLDNGDFAVICYCNSGFDTDKMITSISSFEISNRDGVPITAARFNDVDLIIPAMDGVEHRFNFLASESCVINSDADLSGLAWNCDYNYNDIPASENNGYVPSTDPSAYNEAMRIKICTGGTASARTAWQDAVYSTTDPDVATVDTDGTIHAAGAGTAVITASAGSLHIDRLVIVADPDVYNNYNGGDLLTKWISVGEFTRINTVWEGSDFTSDNTSVVTVSADGTVTAVGKGGAAVTNTSVLGIKAVYNYIVF